MKKAVRGIIILSVFLTMTAAWGTFSPAMAGSIVGQYPTYPINGVTVYTPYPTYSWTNSGHTLGWTNICFGTSTAYEYGCGWGASGTPLSMQPTTYPAPLAPNKTWWWTVYGLGTDGNYYNDGNQTFKTGDTAPTVSSVTINSPFIVPNNNTVYTITEDGNTQWGASDILFMFALINYSGPNAGNFRGLLQYYGGNPGWGGEIACSGNGGGYAAVNPDLGSTYIHLQSCTNTLSGNDRIQNFNVTFDPSFTTPLNNNDISGDVSNTVSQDSGWVNFNTNFSLAQPPTMNSINIYNPYPPVVYSDGTTQYTITAIATDPQGTSHIMSNQNIINYGGENAGQYRGYFLWEAGNWWPGKDQKNCSGGGYGNIQNTAGNAYLDLVSCAISDSGNTRTFTYVVTFSTANPPLVDNDISGYVDDDLGYHNGWINFQTNFTIDNLPVINNVTMSSPIFLPDGGTPYTISVQVSDGNGGTDIQLVAAEINSGGENAGQYRGLLQWQLSSSPGGKDPQTCSGAGYGGIYNVDFGNTYLDLNSCNVTTAGNTRTVNFVVRFATSFTSPMDNDIGGFARDSLGLANFGTQYVNFQTNFAPELPPTETSMTLNSLNTGATGCYFPGQPNLTTQTAGWLPSLQSYWSMDTSGTSVPDQWGGNTGTAHGTTTAPGIVSNARQFNGTSDYIQTANPIYPRNGGSFSITAWINRTKDNQNGWVDDNNWITGNRGSGNNFTWYSSFDLSGNLQLWWENGAWIPVIPAANLPKNQWHHVAIVINGWCGATNNLLGYVDGVLVSQHTLNVCSVYGPQDPVWIGGRNDLNRYFGGYLDEVAVWNRTLTSNEVAALAGAISCNSGSSTPTSTVVADNTQKYPLVSQADDPNGGTDIVAQYAYINQGGPNAGKYRGYLTWTKTNTWPTYQDAHACSGGGGGYAVIQPGNASQVNGTGAYYVHLDNCISYTTGTSHYVIFYLRIDPAYGPAGPLSGNDISGYAGDTLNGNSGWIDFPLNFNVCPGTETISGTVDSSVLPSGTNTTVYANFTASNPISAPGGNYFITVPYSYPTATTYNITSQAVSGYSYLPVTTPVSVSCSDLTGPALKYYLNSCPATPDNNLVAAYHFDETPISGVGINPVVDSSVTPPANNNGTATGTTIVASTVPGGSYANARQFNGTSDYINIPNATQLNPSAITVAAWVKTTSTGSSIQIVGKTTSCASSGYLIWLNENNIPGAGKPGFWVGSGPWLDSPTAINDGQWHQVVGTYDGTTANIYVGGVLSASGARTGSLSSSSPLQIGAATTGGGCNFGGWFNGSIDEVRIWNRALLNWEVGGEYQTLCRTGVKVNCQPWSACQNPQGTNISCGTGFNYRTCVDSGDSSTINDTPTACSVSHNYNITGQLMNVPTPPGTVTVTATNGTNNYTSSPSNGTYSISAPTNGTTTYTLSSTPVSGYTISPNNYSFTLSCSDYQGPPFWYNNDAGAVIQSTPGQTSPRYYGAGGVSQSGTTPGYRLENYTNSGPVNHATYSSLLSAVFKNAGLTSNPCLSFNPAPGILNIGNYTFYCYNSSYPFENVLNSALQTGPASPNIIVLYPDPVSPAAQQYITSAKSVNNKTLVIFINGSLEVQAPITVTKDANSSGAVFILNNPDTTNPATSGNFLVDSAVGCPTSNPTCNSPVTGVLDGIYVFPGFFSDTQGGGNTGAKLAGYGSLLSIGGQALNLGRTYDSASGPAEEWHYQAKYLQMYENVLSSPRFIWQELTPQ